MAMEPIVLNLLAEERQAERTEARDPVKAAFAIGAMLAMLCVAAGSFLTLREGQTRQAALGIEKRYADLTAAQSDGALKDLKTAKAFAQDVIQISTARCLFAPYLALFKDAMPDTVQLTRLNMGLNAEVVNTAAPVLDDGEDGGQKDKLAKPARPRSIDRLGLQLEGRALSARPELEVDTFIKLLRAHPGLKEQLKDVQLRSIARLPAEAGGTPAVAFVIDCQFKERK